MYFEYASDLVVWSIIYLIVSALLAFIPASIAEKRGIAWELIGQ